MAFCTGIKHLAVDAARIFAKRLSYSRNICCVSTDSRPDGTSGAGSITCRLFRFAGCLPDAWATYRASAGTGTDDSPGPDAVCIARRLLCASASTPADRGGRRLWNVKRIMRRRFAYSRHQSWDMVVRRFGRGVYC